MRQFDVIVHPKMVTVKERDIPMSNYDVSANVDGDKWLYCIKKEPKSKLDKSWRERGYTHAYYHAKNSGNHVQFNRVDAQHNSRPRKRHRLHLRLFD